MKRKILKVSVLSIMLVVLMQIVSFATLGKITLNTKTDKSQYKVGDTVIVTIDWEKDVQAAGLTIKYDKEKLEFKSTEVGANFYNAETAGEILFNWASFDGTNMKSVSFVLTAKVEGSAVISVEGAKGFADENLEEAEEYAYTNKTITISKVEETQETPKEETPKQETPKEETPKEETPKQETPKEETPKIEIPKAETSSSTSGKKDDTTASGKMPQTGAESTILFIIGTVVVIGIIGLRKYKTLSDI